MIRKLLRTRWPNLSESRQRRYILAALNYINNKANLTPNEFRKLSANMIRVHGINPNSPLAHEMREERQKGLEQGREQGIDIGIDIGQDKMAVTIIKGLLANNVSWPLIQDATGVSQAEWPALQERVKLLP